MNIGDLFEVEGPDNVVRRMVLVKDDPDHNGWIFKDPKEKDLSRNMMIVRYKLKDKILRCVSQRAYNVKPVKTDAYWRFELEFI